MAAEDATEAGSEPGATDSRDAKPTDEALDKAAVALISAWHKMRCRNGVLIEMSPLLSSRVRSNALPELLGAGAEAKAAGMYMCKYMVKEAYELSSSLSVLIAARLQVT